MKIGFIKHMLEIWGWEHETFHWHVCKQAQRRLDMLRRNLPLCEVSIKMYACHINATEEQQRNTKPLGCRQSVHSTLCSRLSSVLITTPGEARTRDSETSQRKWDQQNELRFPTSRGWRGDLELDLFLIKSHSNPAGFTTNSWWLLAQGRGGLGHHVKCWYQFFHQ